MYYPNVSILPYYSAEDKKDSDIWLEFVRNRFPQFDVVYSDLSASVSCHVGPEAAGIAVVKRTKAE